MRRKTIALGLATLLSLAVAAPSIAADPRAGTGTGGEPPGDNRVLPLTPSQQKSRVLKEALIQRVPLTRGANQSRELINPSGGPVAAQSAQAASGPAYGTILNISPRQQTKSYYCGPAVVQLVSNYSHQMAPSANWYTQQRISDLWTKTDANGQTYLGDLINGMNGASVLPSGFAYIQKHNPTFTDWHNTIISGVYDWRMPLAAGVIPRKSGATYRLVSWNIVSNAGHYIEIHGYVGFVQNPQKWVFFSDTAGMYASSTAGNYKQSSFAVYKTMMYNNGNMVY